MKRHVFLIFIWAAFFTAISCSQNPKDLAAKHTRKGDLYFSEKKFMEAAVEYRNAIKGAPEDAGLRWKLAQSAMEARDFPLAFRELQKTVELDQGNYEAKGRLGEIYIAAGKFDEAVEIIEDFVKNRPKEPKGYVLNAGLLVRSGDLDGSIEKMKKAIEIDPENIQFSLTVGNLYVLKRNAAEALQWYDRALAIDADFVDALIRKGDLFFATEKREEGEKLYRRAIELSENKEIIRLSLAKHYLHQRRLQDAEDELNSLIQEEGSGRARKVLAEVKVETGKLDEAISIVEDILSENRKDLAGKFLKARIALAEKRFNDAKVLFGEVIRKDAELAPARLFNGMNEVMLGNIETGKKEVQEAVRLNPRYMRGHLVLANLHLKTNDPISAEKEALEILRVNPTDVPAFVIYGDSFLLRKDWSKAEEVYGALIKQIPDNPLGYFKMGISRKLQGRPGKAVKYFSQALSRNPDDLNTVNEYIFTLIAAKDREKAESVMNDYVRKVPDNPRIWEMKGRMSLGLKQPEDAEAAFLKAVDLDPDFTRPYYELGVLYSSLGRLPEAEQRFRDVLEKDAYNVGAHTLLGTALNLQGRFEEANAHYRQALDLSPRNALAANNLASNLSDHGGNIDEALKYAQIAREVSPDSAAVADTLGWIYFKKGVVEAARPLIEEAAAKLQNNPVVRYHYGSVLAEKGRRKEAKAELEAALKLNPDFPGAEEAKKLLDRLQ